MKRFIVFCIRQYYPIGGIRDAEESFDTKEEAIVFAEERLKRHYRNDRCHIFDCDTRQEVWNKCQGDKS